jgi:hypothetical protein
VRCLRLILRFFRISPPPGVHELPLIERSTIMQRRRASASVIGGRTLSEWRAFPAKVTRGGGIRKGAFPCINIMELRS